MNQEHSHHRAEDDELPEDHHLHHEYIKKILAREARREELHRAIIEKSLTALIWSGITGASLFLFNTMKDHWK